jgi:predicted DNA-binding ribbon-helix-helix protein
MSAIRKRSLSIAGHRTSISLEQEFWDALAEAAAAKQKSTSALVVEIDKQRQQHNLSSALRVWVLNHLRAQVPGVAQMAPAPGLAETAVQPSSAPQPDDA